MAEAVISAVVDVTLSKAISIVEKQINHQWDFKDELEKLGDSLTLTRAFLRDAERRQVDDEAVQVWLKQLRKIACEADDVLDEIAFEDLRRKVETQMTKKIRNLFSISKNSIVFKMPRTVKGLNISLNQINDRAREFGLQQRVQTLAPLSRGGEATHSFVDSSQVVGREADASKIIDLLIVSSSRQTFSLVSIVGMGGLGKTTLAKTVCNDERTKRYFNEIIWVCVSEKFDVEKILEEIFESLTRQSCELKSRNVMIEKIKKKLEGKTYLLVLDDVWDEEFKAWEDLRGSLLGINENKRSSILVTSRSEKVIVVQDTPLENRYPLKSLTYDECWAIIKNRAFTNSWIPPEMEVIGKDIALKCGGVPLVANVIGGTMSNKWDLDEWVSLRDSSSWGSLEVNEGIISVLKLSFDRLPSPSLKQCFVYCSIFPKDFRMEKEQLVQLWMAEGFLQQTRGKAFKDIGDEYFNYLLSISLLQDVERDWLGCITSCKMHDFLHDLALSIGNSEISGTCQIQQQTAYDGAKLWHSFFSKSSHFDIVVNFKGLRVLSFCDADISSLPESIGRLKRLRYLDISNTHIDRLPKSITHLYLLQTLRLLRCFSLKKLPEGMKKLVSLKHLYISYTKHVPSEIGCLTDLQILPIFDVGRERGYGIGELRCLNELGGELKISNLQDVRNKEEAQRAKIWEKKKLRSLKFQWGYMREGEVSKDDEEVLEGLEPHSNLKSLTIESYRGDNCPSWLVFRKRSVSSQTASFQPINLLVLRIEGCPNLSSVPVMSRFSSLETLMIGSCDELTWIGDGDADGVFPSSLKVLEIWRCKKLRSIPSVEGEGGMSSLEKLNVVGCDELREIEEGLFAFSTCLRDVSIKDCPNLISIPSIQGCSSLLSLTLARCKGLTWIGDADEVFPLSLEVLEIVECRKLRSIPSVEAEGEGVISSLQKLYVSGCDELSMIGDGGGFPPSLKEIKLWKCRKLRSIPSVEAEGFISSLEDLHVSGCDELREIEEGLLASSTCLRDLRIEHCPNLISIPSIQGCSSLLSLTLSRCKGLTSLPSGLRTSTSLQVLIIVSCNSLKSIPEDILSLGCLTHLKTLWLGPFSEELEEFPGLTSIHHLHYSSLQSLTLVEKLVSLPHQLQHLTALETLDIYNFSGVKAFPVQWLGNLSNLKTLSLGSFSEEMEEFPDLHLHYSSLQSLTLYGSKKLVSLPHQLQHLTALETLKIYKFNGVKALPEWLGNLSSLRSLDIYFCENLEHLPSAEAMQRLSNLQTLSIFGCPRFKGNSEEWSKISHIPKIYW